VDRPQNPHGRATAAFSNTTCHPHKHADAYGKQPERENQRERWSDGASLRIAVGLAGEHVDLIQGRQRGTDRFYTILAWHMRGAPCFRSLK
jgi:hypothetical protein